MVFLTFLFLKICYARQVGIFAALVGKLPIICATLVLILCAKDVLRMLIMYVYEETMDFVERA